MLNDPIVIVGAARTPMGGFQGDFASLAASDLGAVAIRAAVERAGVAPGDVDKAIMGCVLPAGQGQAPARQAALKAGLPQSVPCTTVNKMCGSAMEAAILAHDMLAAGSHDVIVAGGMEAMSNAPYLLPKARAGYRMGHQTVCDHMFLDGLEDAYEKGRLMGTFAEDCAAKFAFTREEQDRYALASLSRALAANEDGTFAWEIAPVTVAGRKGEVVIYRDEQPAKAAPDKIPLLKPAFRKDGTVTAANSSSISDGAAALVLMERRAAEARGLAPLARLVSYAHAGVDPAYMGIGPVPASRKALEKAGLRAHEIDVVEANEAFAAQALAVTRDLDLDPARVNPNGSGISIGHPVGATGALITVKALYELQRTGGRRALVTMCIGG